MYLYNRTIVDMNGIIIEIASQILCHSLFLSPLFPLTLNPLGMGWSCSWPHPHPTTVLIPVTGRLLKTILCPYLILPWVDLAKRSRSSIQSVILALLECMCPRMADWAMHPLRLKLNFPCVGTHASVHGCLRTRI